MEKISYVSLFERCVITGSWSDNDLDMLARDEMTYGWLYEEDCIEPPWAKNLVELRFAMYEYLRRSAGIEVRS